jgi:hypothetical protein
MTTTQLDDSKNTGNELDKIFAPLIDSTSLTLTTTYWKEAKRQIQELIEQQVLIGRIDELGNVLPLLDEEFAYYSGGKPYSNATGTENKNARTKKVIETRQKTLKAQLKEK